MDRAQIERAIAELDARVPKDDARVAINQYGGGPDECTLIANERGYLRFGIELLKAAYAPAGVGDNKVAVPLDVDYLIGDDSEVQIELAERRDPDVRTIDYSWDFSSLLAMFCGLSLVTVFTIGCYTVATYVMSFFQAH